MARKKIRLRQLYWILGLTLLGIILAPSLRFLWHPPPSPQTAAPEPPLPWRVALDTRGRPVVFGLTLAGNTVADARRQLGEDGQWAILERKGSAHVLEAYYPDFTAGHIEGKLILRFEGEPALLEREFARRGKKAPTAGGARKVELKDSELAPFAGLTLTLVTGVLFAETLFGQALRVDHKTVFAFISWLLFGGLLVGRRLWGWRGRVALRWTLAGFVALMLAYVGSRFVIEVVLHRAG